MSKGDQQSAGIQNVRRTCNVFYATEGGNGQEWVDFWGFLSQNSKEI